MEKLHTVLIVLNKPEIVPVLTKELKKTIENFLVAENVEDCKRLLMNETPQLLISSFEFLNDNNLEFLKYLRQSKRMKDREIPILVLNSFPENNDDCQSWNQQFNFISGLKVPFASSEVLKAVDKLFELAQQEELKETKPVAPAVAPSKNENTQPAPSSHATNNVQEGMKEINLKAGDVLIHEGENDATMYWLKEGKLEVFQKASLKHQHAEKQDCCLFIEIPKGEVVGELSFLDSRPRSASVRAKTDCVVVPVPIAFFNGLLAKQPPVIRSLIKTLCERLRKTDEHFHL